MQQTDQAKLALIAAEMGRQLNETADNWRNATFAEQPDCAIREAMQRPNIAAGRFVGRYVLIAANPAGLIIGAFVAEFDVRTKSLVTTPKTFTEPMRPEDMPEPFRTLGTSRGSGFIAIAKEAA